MRYERTITPPAPDRDGICLAQTRGSGGALTLNGPSVVGDIAIFSDASHVSVYSAGDLSGLTFTVSGSDRYGNPQGETIAGPGAGATVVTSRNFKTVDGVTASGAVATNVEVGIAANLESCWVPVDRRTVTTIAATLSAGASLTYGLQVTCDDVFAVGDGNAVAFDDATMTGKTANSKVTLGEVVAAVRLKISGYASGTITLVALQDDT